MCFAWDCGSFNHADQWSLDYPCYQIEPQTQTIAKQMLDAISVMIVLQSLQSVITKEFCGAAEIQPSV
ncbi:MAG: hypothetical protein ACLSA6_12000 [Holdemania massiliensis]